MSDRSDQGIVAYLEKDATAARYVNKQGVATASIALSGSYQDSTVINVGAASALSAQVIVAFETTGSTGVKVKCMTKRLDENNPTVWSYVDILTVRADTGTTAIEHAVTSAAEFLLQTTDHQLSDYVKFQVKSTGGVVKTGDYVIVGVNAA